MKSATPSILKPDHFVVLRTPLQSEQALLDWQGSRQQLREQLAHWLNKPDVQEALYLASPSLLERVAHWQRDPSSSKGRKIEQALCKYFIRMTSRSTPFGLFAGISVGMIGETLNLTLDDGIAKRYSRLDALIIFQLKQHLSQQPEVIKHLPLTTNQSLYQTGDTYRYIEAISKNNQQSYQLSAFSYNPYIEHLLTKANGHCTAWQLAESLHQLDSDISVEEAWPFVIELINNNILLPDLPFYLTGENSEQHFINALRQSGDSHPLCLEIADTLNDILQTLRQMDQASENAVEQYKQLQQQLNTLPIDIAENRMIQTDSYQQHSNFTLSERVANSLCKDLMLLQKLPAKPNDMLAEFKQAFLRRYEQTMVPLLDALDDESGIGFSENKGIDSSLLQGLPTNRALQQQVIAWRTIDTLLLQKLGECQRHQHTEISLTQNDINIIASTPVHQNPPTLMATFTLFAQSVQAVARGQFKANFFGASGPSPSIVLGRFCHLDDTLKQAVKQTLNYEATCYDGALLAEIVHLPEGRIGNVIARPVLRDMEIPILAETNNDETTALTLSDLMVYIEHDRVKLWSQSQQKEVIPRLSSAHNFSKNSLGIYQFLSTVQHQQRHLPRFVLSDPIKQLPWFPRVTLGKLILSAQRWRVERTALETLANTADEHYQQATTELMEQYKLPEWLCWSHNDLVITINLRNPLHLDTLLSETRHLTLIDLEEKYPDGEQYPVTQHGKIKQHELVVPLRNPSFRYQATRQPPPVFTPVAATSAVTANNDLTPNTITAFQPGDEWLCVKIYTGVQGADRILDHHLSDWLQTLKMQQRIKSLFFLRFSDPDWHIRLRIQLADKDDPTRIANQLWQHLNVAQQQKLISRIEVVPYLREVERYGGSKGITIAEQFFTIDSLCVLQLLPLFAEQDDDYRWQVTLVGCDQLLSGLKLTNEQRFKTIESLRRGYGEEFNETGRLRQLIGKKYSRYQGQITALLSQPSSIGVSDSRFHAAFDVLANRSLSMQTIANQLHKQATCGQLTCSLERIATSYLHMFTNRALQHKGREYELMIYDFLLRYYKQQARRNNTN